MSNLDCARPRRRSKTVPAAAFTGACLLALLLAAPTRAVEVLTVHELISHCEVMETEPEGADAQYCTRYIQGFIDGAVAIDERVMLGTEVDQERPETFSERAMRTRASTRSERFQAAQMAGFCLGDPLPLRDVVNVVVTDLSTLDTGVTAGSPARDAVYESLRLHYSCDHD